MEQIKFNYSLKNIPIPSVNLYKKRLIEKVEAVIKRMRWKAFFFTNKKESMDSNDATTIDDKFGFKSRKCPPQIEEMKSFENDLLRMVENIQTRSANDPFQQKLKEDVQKVKSSTKLFIPADKTKNLYKIDKAQYEKLVTDNITKSYKKLTKKHTTI